MIRHLIIALLFAFIMPIDSFEWVKKNEEHKNPEKELFQVSTLQALEKGVFDGDYTLKGLEKKGDLGIGIFNDLNGELVAMDGNYYRIDPKGKVSLAKEGEVIPFAQVLFFQPTSKFKLKNQTSLSALMKQVSGEFINRNVPHAVYIKGTFPFVVVRSLAKQKKPSPPLSQAELQQTERSRQNVKGMVVGFWFPEYLSDIANPGLYLNFLSEDHEFGGHVQSLSLLEGTVSIQPIFEYQIHFPNVKNFAEAKFHRRY